MADMLKVLIEAMKLAPRYLAAICVAAAFLLLSPKDWLDVLGAAEFAEHNRLILGLTAVLGFAALVVAASKTAWRWISILIQRRIKSQRIVDYLGQLTEDEANILNLYIDSETRTKTLDISNGVVNGLIHAGVLYRSSNLGRSTYFDVNITPVAWKCLHERDAIE